MKWALILVLLLSLTTETQSRTVPDESDPELVEAYLYFSCEALDQSYSFQYEELTHLVRHLQACYEAAKSTPDDKYGKLKCGYVKLQWELMYIHAKSAEKAWDLVCTDDGTLKNPRYEIHF